MLGALLSLKLWYNPTMDTNEMPRENRWGNSTVYYLNETQTDVQFRPHGDTSVYRCSKAAWLINPLPRNLKAPE